MESFEMWCCRVMEMTSLTGSVRNEVLHRVKEEKDIYIQYLHTIKKDNRIGHIFHRNLLLKQVLQER